MENDIEKEFEYMNAVIKNTSTDALVAELEMRRPCEECRGDFVDRWRCMACIYNSKNNFKAKP